MRLLRRSVLPGLVVLALSSPALADPAMWKVSDADSEIYLFGSIHAFTREVDWRTPEFDDILRSAEHVYFEVVMDVEAYSTVTQITMTKGRITDGGTLADLLTPEQQQRFEAAAARVGADTAILSGMQPWLANMTLAAIALPMSTAGVETLVEPEVAPERKRSLETAAEQMGFLSDVPLDEQIASLMSTVDGIENGAVLDLEPLMVAWERGDTAGLDDAMTSYMTPADKPLYDTLITERNERWLIPLEQLLADNDESLIIVGAGHLVGPEGVPALLEQRGYSVERIDEPLSSGPPAPTSSGARRR